MFSRRVLALAVLCTLGVTAFVAGQHTDAAIFLSVAMLLWGSSD